MGLGSPVSMWNHVLTLSIHFIFLNKYVIQKPTFLTFIQWKDKVIFNVFFKCK